jgi:hypothetical protein
MSSCMVMKFHAQQQDKGMQILFEETENPW